MSDSLWTGLTVGKGSFHSLVEQPLRVALAVPLVCLYTDAEPVSIGILLMNEPMIRPKLLHAYSVKPCINWRKFGAASVLHIEVTGSS